MLVAEFITLPTLKTELYRCRLWKACLRKVYFYFTHADYQGHWWGLRVYYTFFFKIRMQNHLPKPYMKTREVDSRPDGEVCIPLISGSVWLYVRIASGGKERSGVYGSTPSSLPSGDLCGSSRAHGTSITEPVLTPTVKKKNNKKM